jgi:O-antigen/teichoic acid export membrane protein
MDTIKRTMGRLFGPNRVGPAAVAKEVKNHFQTDSLFQNSVYLMGTAGVMAFFGFVFWIIAARMYEPSEIGFATALISATTLLASFSGLEFNTGLVRFIPKSKNPNMMINTALIAVAFATVIVSGIYLLGIHHFAPEFEALTSNLSYAILFMVFMVMVSLNVLTDSVFVANRAAKYNLLVYTSFGIVKVILPLLLLGLGAYGIFFAYTGSVIVSLALSFYFMRTKLNYRFHWVIEKVAALKMVKFSLGNYIASSLILLPGLIMPTLIVSHLGTEEAAFYYMAATIAALLYIVPSATTSSLLAEGSHNSEEIKNFVRKASKLIAMLLIPAVAFILLFDKYILLIFGGVYAEHSSDLLNIMGVTALFMGINMVCETILQVRHEVKKLIAVSVGYVIVTMVMAFWLLDRHGVIGAGFALLAGQVFLAVEYLALFGWRRLFNAK